MAKRILFDRSGHYLVGTKKGIHASGLPLDYVQWASLNIDGFKEQYAALARGESLPEPKPVSVKPFKAKPTGRRYFISKTKRHYTP